MKRPLGSPWKTVSVGALLALLALVLLTACSALESEPQPRVVIDQSRSVAVDAPPCVPFADSPYRNTLIICNEIVYDHVVPPEAAPEINDLALGDDGTLYVVHTAAGEIRAIPDVDRVRDEGAPFLVADGLDLPLHVAVDGAALFVVTADDLLRIDLAPPVDAREPEVLVADVGGGSRLWPGAVHIGPDDRLYVGVGASDAAPGAVLSFARDGSDRQVVATGLRYPLDFTWHPHSGDLWIADSRGAGAAYDAIFRVPAGSESALDFGYPECRTGTEPACAEFPPPAFTFDDQSTPSSLAFYTAEEWPFWTGDLFVTLAGSWNRAVPSGYAIDVLDVNDAALLSGAFEYAMPNSESSWAGDTLDRFSMNDIGFFPERPVDSVFDQQGWLYIALSEGRIYRMRPRPATE